MPLWFWTNVHHCPNWVWRPAVWVTKKEKANIWMAVGNLIYSHCLAVNYAFKETRNSYFTDSSYVVTIFFKICLCMSFFYFFFFFSSFCVFCVFCVDFLTSVLSLCLWCQVFREFFLTLKKLTEPCSGSGWAFSGLLKNEGGLKGPLTKFSYTYPTMMKPDTVIPHLKKI